MSRSWLMRSFDWKGLWIPQWPPWEVAFRATVIYFVAQILFRIAGRKEFLRYATHDIVLLFLVSVSVRPAIVGNDMSLTSSVVGFATIIGWDALLSYLAYRDSRAASVIEGPVRRLVVDGRLEQEALAKAHISRDELLSQLRQHGTDDFTIVRAAYLERSGRVIFLFRETGAGAPAGG